MTLGRAEGEVRPAAELGRLVVADAAAPAEAELLVGAVGAGAVRQRGPEDLRHSSGIVITRTSHYGELRYERHGLEW
jgi:hypothetical protein